MSDLYGLTVDNMLFTLPTVLQNSPKMYAVAQSIAILLEKRAEEINKLRIYTAIDSLPESLLDVLAYDFKVDWYDSNYSLETKRNVLKSCFDVYRRLGTKGAFLEALRNAYPDSDIEEWFEYDGNPFYFRIILDVSQQRETISHSDIVRKVEPFKRLTARLETAVINYKVSTKIKIKASAGYAYPVVRKCGTYPAQLF